MLLSDDRALFTHTQLELLGSIPSECELIMSIFEAQTKLAIVMIGNVHRSCNILAETGISIRVH